MICRNCLRRASALRPSISASRQFSISSASRALSTENAPPGTGGAPAATSTGLAQPFSTPLTPKPNEVSLGKGLQPKTKTVQIPVSSCPAGTPMKGINFLKGRDDPVALPEEEYPEWLWTCLDAKAKEDKDSGVADEFSKSKKVRRKAAKAQRKLEARMIASGDMSLLQPKIPITKQSIDLPSNEEGTVAGAMKADARREELRNAMRVERRASIKEANFLKGM